MKAKHALTDGQKKAVVEKVLYRKRMGHEAGCPEALGSFASELTPDERFFFTGCKICFFLFPNKGRAKDKKLTNLNCPCGCYSLKYVKKVFWKKMQLEVPNETGS